VKANRKGWMLVVLLAALQMPVLFAGFVAPYNFSKQNREWPFARPTRIHFVDANGKSHLRPFVYGLSEDPGTPEANAANSAQIYPIRFFVLGAPYRLAGMFSGRRHLFGVDDPACVFLMGTDEYGRDQFTRFLYGGQISLAAGLLAAACSVFLGALTGALAGFYGGWADHLLMRAGDAFVALPWLYLLFAVRAALPLHVAQWQVFLLMVAVIGAIGWARPARLIRGVVLSAKERSFVTAARGFGASDFYLIRHHILPQAYSVILTQMTLLVPQYILAEVTLTFLGLGIDEPMASWGSLLSVLQQYYVVSSYWWMFLPAMLLVPLFLAYFWTADVLQERMQSVPL
jgi:peptide/nickel transport system permease protein